MTLNKDILITALSFFIFMGVHTPASSAEVSDNAFRSMQKDIKSMSAKIKSLEKQLASTEKNLNEIIAGQKAIIKQMAAEHKQLRIWVRRS